MSHLVPHASQLLLQMHCCYCWLLLLLVVGIVGMQQRHQLLLLLQQLGCSTQPPRLLQVLHHTPPVRLARTPSHT
jgi:hypothetical protein